MMISQKELGPLVMAIGKLILCAIFVLCLVDVYGLSSRGQLLVSLSGYLSAIFLGVIMQFVGAAIPHMKFSARG